MNEEILKELLSMVCNVYFDTIFTAIDEEPTKFPITIACVCLLSEFNSNSLYLRFDDVFTDSIMDKVFDEIKSYLRG